MKVHIGLFSVLIIMTNSVFAQDQYLATFELDRGINDIYRGKILISEKHHTWSKGLKRSYLRMSCKQTESGKVRKLYSTEDHFAGLRVSHQLVANRVEITVSHTTVKPRLAEIHALPKGECKELLPVVTTVTQKYSFTSTDGARETWQFSENVTFRITGELMSEK